MVNHQNRSKQKLREYLAKIDAEMKARDAKPLGERWKDAREFEYDENKMFPYLKDRRTTTD